MQMPDRRLWVLFLVSSAMLWVRSPQSITAGGLHPTAAAPAVVAAAAEEGPHTESGTHGEQQAEGPPLNPKADLALWSLVVFLIFLFVLGRFAWRPLSEALNKREALIRKDIADAETARRRAEQMLAEHSEKLDKVQDEVREIIAEARRDAEHTKQDIVSEAQKEAEATKARALAEIERARSAALKDLFDAMATQVASATEHVLGRSVNNDDQNRLIDEALSHLRQ